MYVHYSVKTKEEKFKKKSTGFIYMIWFYILMKSFVEDMLYHLLSIETTNYRWGFKYSGLKTATMQRWISI
jgi:hypothetical protein